MASVSNEDLIEHIYDASLSPKAWPAKPEVVLSAKLNLSPAEVRVGPALLEGMTPAEAVQVLGLSIHTVRAHLARMFAKTETRRQAEFISLITRTVGGA